MELLDFVLAVWFIAFIFGFLAMIWAIEDGK